MILGDNMSKAKYHCFSKGDVIRTNPENCFYGIAVVLDEPERIELSSGKMSYPMCHIAITPLIFQHEVVLAELNLNDLKPLIFQRYFKRDDGRLIPWKTETCIYIYTNRNKEKLPVLGKIDPSSIYSEPLLFTPQEDRFYFCGDIGSQFGREAYIDQLRNSDSLL